LVLWFSDLDGGSGVLTEGVNAFAISGVCIASEDRSAFATATKSRENELLFGKSQAKIARHTDFVHRKA
jgi:hypothetical protein